MKFRAKVEGLAAGVKPILTVATKGTADDYPHASLVTLTATPTALEAVADGGHVSAKNEINDIMYSGLDYKMIEPGSVTLAVTDFQNVLGSFAESDTVVVELQEKKAADGSLIGKELVIMKESDMEEMQSLAVFDTVVEFHQQTASTKKTSKITLRRDVFTAYANKLVFAHGFQQQLKMFTYWILRSFNSGSLRFAAGTGNRFAIVELEGANISDAKGDMIINFPNAQTPTLTGVLSLLKGENVHIESQDRCIVVTCDNVKVIMYTCDPTVAWPDEEKVLRRPSKFNFVTKVGNWRNALKGVIATYTDDAKKQNQLPNCLLSFDLDKKIIQAKSELGLRSNRKIAIDNIATNEDTQELSIRCNTNYIKDVINQADDEDHIQIEIEDESMPVIIRHYAAPDFRDPLTLKKPNDDGIQERYSEFFATLKKN